MNKIPVGVLGASGYAGRELCALVNSHPSFDLAFAAADAQRGRKMRLGRREVRFIAADDARLESAELVFTALPHGASRCWVEAATAARAAVVDLSADLRPGSGVGDVPYGLTELMRDEVASARITANPGCYATAILLGLAPLLKRKLIPGAATVAITAASGTTGAGMNPKQELLFGEVAEDFRAYAVGNEHRHMLEISSFASSRGCECDIVFTPHLLPVTRGILATMTVPVSDDMDDPLAMWREDYAGETFIELSDEPPTLRDVVRRNTARIGVVRARNVRRPALIVLSALDNLLKGAAGQAIQNANLMMGLPDAVGLPC